MVKHFFLVLSIVILTKSYSQIPVVKESDNNVEVGVFPFYVINSFSLAYSRSTKKLNEHVVNTNVILTYYMFNSYAVHYNFNKKIIGKSQPSNSYIPFWFGVRYGVPGNFSGEGDYAYNLLFYSVGSGIGTRRILKNKNKLKVEFGLGVSMLTEHQLDEAYYLNGYVYPTLRLNLKYVFKLSKKD